MKKLREKIKKLAIEGLTTDGGHHKQWYLEEILKIVGYNTKELQKIYDWEEGIPD